jgi:hypothetical protein
MSKDEDQHQEFDLKEFLDKTTILVPSDSDPGFSRIYKKDDVDVVINAGGEVFKLIFRQQIPNYHVFFKAIKRF